MPDKRPGAPRLSPEGARRLTISISNEDLAELAKIHPQPSKAIRQVMKERKEQTNATDHHRND